jgi:predicted dehydrogenase
MTFGIALIGSGIFAKEEHLPAIKAASSSLALKAIYSRSLASAKSLASEVGDVELYSEDAEGKGYDALLQRDDVQGVVIAYVRFCCIFGCMLGYHANAT